MSPSQLVTNAIALQKQPEKKYKWVGFAVFQWKFIYKN